MRTPTTTNRKHGCTISRSRWAPPVAARIPDPWLCGAVPRRLGSVIALVLMLGAGTAFAQLTPADIEAMRKQGEAEGWTFTVGESEATRRPVEELCGLVVPDDWWVDAPFDPCTPQRDLPSYFNWCDHVGCPRVKNQAGCGSCWAFATVGPLECNILIVDGLEVDLSEQWLVSCSSAGSCNGGRWAHDYHESSSDPCGGTGAVLEEDFPYVAWDAPCECPYPHPYRIDDWSYIGGSGAVAPSLLKQAIMDHGPITVGVSVSNDSFYAYHGGVYNDCDEPNPINHGVTLVGWDDTLGAGGVWVMRNSWGGTWGADPWGQRWPTPNNGYMLIEYGCKGVGSQPAYIVYSGTDALNITFADELPRIVLPGTPLPLTVRIEEVTDVYVPGTAELHYRYDGGARLTETLQPVGAGLFEYALPAPSCDDRVEFYISAQSERGDMLYNPPGGAELPHTIGVGELMPIISDDFETDQGWTVSNSGGLTAGAWERGVPVGLGEHGDPPTDYDGSGQCYLTENVYGNSDVDDGYVYLVSATFDLSSEIAGVHYALWYTNDTGQNGNQDEFNVYVSNDDGENWVLVETIGPASPPEEWIEHSFWVRDFVAPSAQVKVLFEASDLGNGSIVEAGLDDFWVSGIRCVPPPTCDDGIQNQGEERIDCGSPCEPCLCTSDASCDDGLYCNGVEICDEFGDCRLGSGPCPELLCDEDSDACVATYCQSHAECDDGEYCNGQETCVGDTCRSGAAVDCYDGVRCTVDSCNEGADACDNAPSNAVCDNGLYCDGAETCDELLGCLGGDYPCGEQLCRDEDDTCVDCLGDGDCDDGLYCNGAETCDAAGMCEAGTPPCPADYGCYEETDECEPLPGGCCWQGDWCIENETEDSCAAADGEYLGHGITCFSDPDGDERVGCDDVCPLDSEKVDPGICGCGVPDDDLDLDGVVGCRDYCPGTPAGATVDWYGCAVSTGDFDRNTKVDLDDFGYWDRCMTGVGNGRYDRGCGVFDFDADTTVDLLDFAAFQRICIGPPSEGD